MMKNNKDLYDETREAERQFKALYGDTLPSEINPAILDDPETIE